MSTAKAKIAKQRYLAKPECRHHALFSPKTFDFDISTSTSGSFFASNGQTKPLCTNRTNFETRPFCRPGIHHVTKRQPKDRDRQGGQAITLYCRCRDGTPLSSSPPPPWSAELTRSTQPCQEDGPSPPRPSSSFFHAGFKGLDLFAEQLQAALRAQNVSREAFVRNELTRHAFSSGKRAPARRNRGTPKRSRAQQTWRLREVSPAAPPHPLHLWQDRKLYKYV